MEENRKDPGLNLLTTTPKNLTKFVHRVGGLRQFEKDVKELFTWKDPIKTLLAMAVWTIMCLNPILFTIAPHLALIYHLARSYYGKTRRRALGVPEPHSEAGPPNLKPSEYKANLQFIQNSMGMFCDAYDMIQVLSREYLSWKEYAPSDKSKSSDHHHEKTRNPTMLTFQLALSMIPPTLLLFNYVSIPHLMLFGGLFNFLVNTPFFMALHDTFAPILKELLNENWQFARGVAKKWPEVVKVKHGKTSQKGDGIYQVAIYENQRWWLGLGFINYLLTHERPAWSDYTGSIPLPPKNTYAPPPGYVFIDDNILKTSASRPSDSFSYSDFFAASFRLFSSVRCERT
ncbi:Peroxin/Dysferlin domain-containing protein [Paraphysoderma sedebokerense]|nr:Peroxin/Dysferlin domain-containing protein [Paraphysoderma sedebokerense]